MWATISTNPTPQHTHTPHIPPQQRAQHVTVIPFSQGFEFAETVGVVIVIVIVIVSPPLTTSSIFRIVHPKSIEGDPQHPP
jgi:hypothetical protein